MKQLRITVAALVSVGVLSLGATACTPPGGKPITAQDVGDFIGVLIFMTIFTNQGPCGGFFSSPVPNCGVNTTVPPTTPPVTLPEPAGT